MHKDSFSSLIDYLNCLKILKFSMCQTRSPKSLSNALIQVSTTLILKIFKRSKFKS